MARTLYLPKTASLAFPVGLIGSMLRRYETPLKTLAFIDNEHGEAHTPVNAIIDRNVRQPVNKALARSGKPLRVLRLAISPERHHTLAITYEVRGEQPREGYLSIALFEPSKKAQAQERAAEEAGETVEIAPPSRGSKKKHKPRKKKRKPPPALEAIA